MERRSKTESRLAKGMQLNGRESVRVEMVAVECAFAGMGGEKWVDFPSGVVEKHEKASAKFFCFPPCGGFSSTQLSWFQTLSN